MATRTEPDTPFIEVCLLHERLFVSCDCECTCSHGSFFRKDGTLGHIRGTHHSDRCRICDPLRGQKAGDRRSLVRRAGHA